MIITVTAIIIEKIIATVASKCNEVSISTKNAGMRSERIMIACA